MGLQAGALTQLHLQPGDRARRAARHPASTLADSAPDISTSAHPDRAISSTANRQSRWTSSPGTGRGVLFGDRRHDAGPPFVVPHVASSPLLRRSLGVSFLTVPSRTRARGTVGGPHHGGGRGSWDTWSQPGMTRAVISSAAGPGCLAAEEAGASVCRVQCMAGPAWSEPPTCLISSWQRAARAESSSMVWRKNWAMSFSLRSLHRGRTGRSRARP